MQQHKWWWVFFIWAIGVAGVNAYRMYKVIYDKEESKKTLGLPKRCPTQSFWKSLCMTSFSRGDQQTGLLIQIQ
jgi:hypothetical protein